MVAMKTFDLPCMGYAVKADLYEGSADGPTLLSLIGRTSNRKKHHHVNFAERLAAEQGVTTLIFDYSGHGDSPYDIEDIRQAQQFLEVIEAFDWLAEQFPHRPRFVMGSSYGGFMAGHLSRQRALDKLILRAPAIYPTSNFYILKRDEDSAATDVFRRDTLALLTHPILAEAPRFAGQTLLVVHEHDERIPPETTDAFAQAFAADMINVNGITHSLDDATPEQIAAYFDKIYDWLYPSLAAS